MDDGKELRERIMLNYYRFKSVSDLIEQNKIEEARLLLAELQQRYVAVCDENSALKLQIQEYDDILYIARNLVIDRDFYWLITGAVRQGPFCPSCYNEEGLLIRLTGDAKDLFCANCRSIYPALREKGDRAFLAAPDCTAGLMRQEAVSGARKAKIIPFGK
jgi:hypothetical protein